jgi:mycoredoxin
MRSGMAQRTPAPRRVRIHQVNIWRDADAAAIVRSVADGNETIPTVVFADGSAWVNPPPGPLAFG